MRDALWKSGFATRLLFYEGNDAQSPSFAGLLLNYKPDIVIWFQPIPTSKGIVARLLDRGIRVITVGDCSASGREYHYCIDRERAIKGGLFGWRQDGVRSVIVLRDPRCGSASSVALIEKVLRETATPYTFANAESWQLQHALPPYPQAAKGGFIFPWSELAARLAARDPVRFANLAERSRILLMDGPIDLPGSDAIKPLTDVLHVDLHSVTKRIASDLIQSTRSRNGEPVTFEAKWIPGVYKDAVEMPCAGQPRHSAPAHRLGQSKNAV